jgi:hypothetical protein
MAQTHLDELERFANLARARGIALVAITMPYLPMVTDALAHSSRHGILADFNSSQMAARLRRLGITHVNLTDLATFDGRADEFVDPFHPTETAVQRMLIAMLARGDVRALLPEVDPAALAGRLNGATRYEVYRHEF